MSAPVHIICIDDHEIVATGCQANFAKAGLPWTVSWYSTSADAVWPQEGPAVALLDLRLNDGSDPADVIASISAHGVPVVVYTSGEDRYRLRRAIAAGVLAIINKSSPFKELILAIEAALEGKATGSVDWATALDEDEDFTERLSERYLAVLRLYASGLSAEQVAHRLNLKTNTVNKYVAEIKDEYRKVGRLKQNDRVGLAREAERDGIIPSYYD